MCAWYFREEWKKARKGLNIAMAAGPDWVNDRWNLAGQLAEFYGARLRWIERERGSIAGLKEFRAAGVTEKAYREWITSDLNPSVFPGNPARTVHMESHRVLLLHHLASQTLPRRLTLPRRQHPSPHWHLSGSIIVHPIKHCIPVWLRIRTLGTFVIRYSVLAEFRTDRRLRHI